MRGPSENTRLYHFSIPPAMRLNSVNPQLSPLLTQPAPVRSLGIAGVIAIVKPDRPVQARSAGLRVAAGQSSCVCLTNLILICVLDELDAVQIQSAIADRAGDSDPFLASGRKKFNLNLRSQSQVGESEQTIPTSLRLMPRASIRAEPVNICTEVFSNWRCRRRRSGLELNLRFIGQRQRGQVSAAIPAGEDYGGSAPCQWGLGDSRERRFSRGLLL